MKRAELRRLFELVIEAEWQHASDVNCRRGDMKIASSRELAERARRHLMAALDQVRAFGFIE